MTYRIFLIFGLFFSIVLLIFNLFLILNGLKILTLDFLNIYSLFIKPVFICAVFWAFGRIAIECYNDKNLSWLLLGYIISSLVFVFSFPLVLKIKLSTMLVTMLFLALSFILYFLNFMFLEIINLIFAKYEKVFYFFLFFCFFEMVIVFFLKKEKFLLPYIYFVENVLMISVFLKYFAKSFSFNGEPSKTERSV